MGAVVWVIKNKLSTYETFGIYQENRIGRSGAALAFLFWATKGVSLCRGSEGKREI